MDPAKRSKLVGILGAAEADITDEEDAVKHYVEMANQAQAVGASNIANTYRNMASDELRHKHNNEIIRDTFARVLREANEYGPASNIGAKGISNPQGGITDYFVIVSSEGYWNNKDGWGSKDSATRFTVAQMKSLRLPVGKNVRWAPVRR